jgi:hypothetical protein
MYRLLAVQVREQEQYRRCRCMPNVERLTRHAADGAGATEIVDYLTENGVMDPKRLYECPFTDVNPRGPEGDTPGSWHSQFRPSNDELRFVVELQT